MRDRHDDPSATDPLPGLHGVGRTNSVSPGAGPEAAQGVDHVGDVGDVGRIEAATAASAAAAASEIGATSAIASDPIAAISEALSTGAIDAETARTQLIDAVVASQMPAGADPAVWQEIRAEVEALLAGDPALADLLRV
jgi:hypothetical protein